MANNVTVNFTQHVCTTDPLGVGFVVSEFAPPGATAIPMVGNATWKANLTALAPGHIRCSVAWYGGSPGYGAGGSSRAHGTATAMINTIKGMGAIPLVSFNGDSADNNFNPADGGALVHYFNDNGGQNGGRIQYWSIGNEADNGGQASINTYEAGSGQGSATATLAAMHAADSTINIGIPAAASWNTGFISWAAGQSGINALSYHAYDGGNGGGSGFPNGGQLYTHVHTDLPGYKAGLLYGVEEMNWNPSYSGQTQYYDWHNCNFIADNCGMALSAGGHASVYSDFGTALGLMNDGTGANNQPGSFATPFPAYYGLGIWTGMNGQFKRWSTHMVSASTTFARSTLTVYASDNGKIVICNNSGSGQTLSIGVTLAGGATSGTYNIWATNGTNPLTAIAKVVSAAQFSGGVITYTIPAQTVVSVDVTAGGSGGNTVTVTNPGSQSSTSGAVTSLQMNASDSASGQTLTYSATGLPPGLSIGNGGPSWDLSGNYTMIFYDEFNGASLDTTKWQAGWFGTGITGPINSAETAKYSSSNVSVSGGTLNLLLTNTSSDGGTHPNTGAAVSSNPHDGRASGGLEFTYGSVEWRAYIPPDGTGTAIANWPALWMDGQNWPTTGEFDVMEGLSGTAQWHIPTNSGNPGGGGSGTYYGWHLFGVKWLSNGSVTFYYDGVAVSSGLTAPNNAPMYLIMDNTQGSFGGAGAFPATMQVDWVRVWQPGVSVARISGTPTAAGTYTVSVTATDTTSAAGSTSFVWTINAASGNTVTVTNPGNQTGVVGTAITTLQIQATDSALGQTLTYTQTGLPAGLSISSSTGAITGTPTTATTYSVSVTVTDGTGASGSTSFSWVISPSGGPGTTLTLVNNFSEGTNGTTITTGNSTGAGQNAFDTVTITNGAAVFSATQAIHSALSGAFSTTAGSGVANVGWTTSLGTQTSIYGRVYFYLSAYPASTDANIQHKGTGASAGGNIQIDTTGHLVAQTPGFTTAFTFTNAIPAAQWVRVEWFMKTGIAGAAQLTVNYYASADSTTATESHTDTTNAWGGTGGVAEVDFGWTNSHPSQPIMYLGNLNVNNSGYPGPASNNVLLVNNFESGVNNASISIANSGSSVANAFDGVAQVASTPNNTPIFAQFAAHGLLSAVVATFTGTAAGPCNFYWSTSLGAQPVVYGRAYFYISSFPSTDDTVVQFYNGGTFGGGIMFTAAGTIGVQSAGFAEFFSSLTIQLNQWFWVEWQVVASAAGSASCTVTLHAAIDSTTVTSTVTDTTGQYGSGGIINKVAFGWNTAHPNQPAMYIDDVGVSTTGYLGPAGHPSSGSLALQPFAFTSSGTDANNLLYNNFEGGTNGTTITTGNSGGTSGHAFDIATVTNGSLTFSTTQAAHGSFSGAMSTTATGGVAYIGWSTSLGTQTTLYGRFNIYLTAYPAVVDANVQMKGTGSSSAGNLQIDTSGHLIAQTTTFANAFVFTNAIPLNTWVRVEWYLKGGTAGNAQFTINYYATLDSVTVTESHTDTTYAWGGTGGTIAEMDFGWTNTHPSQPTIYMDDLAMSPAQFLGPAGINCAGNLSLQSFQLTSAAVDNKGESGTGSVALQPFTFTAAGSTSHVPVARNLVSGNIINDYGLDNVFYTVSTTGATTGLVAFIGWDIARSTASTSGKGPAVNVTDSAGNLWRQTAITQVSGTSRAAIWFCDNPRQVQWVSVAVTGWAYSTSYTIAEIDNLPVGFNAVSLDFVEAAHSDTPVTSLTVPSGTVSSSDICFAVLSTGGAGGALTVPTGWSGIAAAGGALAAQATTYSMYIPTQGAGAVAFTPNWVTAQPASGAIVGLKLTAAAPVQPNPNFPVVAVEAAFGADPGDYTQSVDYTWAGSVGWSFVASGTPTNGNYFIVFANQAPAISVGQQFYDNYNGTTVFTVTSLAPPFAGFVNVSFTPTASVIMSNPDIVNQTVVWTDISSRVIGDGTAGRIRVTRGRQYELSEEETGEIQITLDNHDGVFTYGNTNSPYYPNCVPGVPIRVTAWFNGVQYPVAFGYVERWPQGWPDLPQWGFSTVIATDAYGALASSSLPSAVEGEVRKDSPYVYFPTDEQYSFTSQSLDPIKFPIDANGLLAVNKAPGNSRYGAYRDGFDQPVNTGQALNLLGDGDTVMGASSYSGPETNDNGPGMFYFDPNIPTNSSGQGVTFEFWFTWGNGLLAANTYFSAWGPPSSFFGTSNVNGGVISVGVNIGSNTAKATGFFVNGVEIASGNATWNQNNFGPQHFVLTSLNSTNLTYLNSVSVSIPSAAVPVLSSIRALTLGPARFSYDVSDLVVYNGFNFTAGHLAVYPYTLTAQQVQNHYSAGASGAGFIPAPGRFAQVLTWGLLGLKRGGTAWYGAYGNAENTYMSEAYDFEGSTGAEVMSRLVQTEGGRCFTQGNGSLVYVMRWSLYNQAAVATFGDNGTTELPFLQESSFSVDNSFIHNTIQVTQNRGPDQVFIYQQSDSASRQDFFQRTGLQVQSYALSPFDVFDSGNWLMAKYKQPVQRVQQLSLDAAASQVKNPAFFPTILSLELQKTVTVNRRPIGGALLSVTGNIQEIQHDIGPAVWKTRYQIAPVVPENQALIADISGQNTPGTQYLSW